MGRLYTAQIEIAAPAERVWDILCDLEGYGRWNGFTPRVEGEPVVGQQLELLVDLGGARLRRQRETLLRWEPGVELRWGLVLHRAIFWAERWQRVEALGPARCRYSTGERFTGIGAPLVDLLYGARVEAGFARVARDLAAHAEGRDSG